MSTEKNTDPIPKEENDLIDKASKQEQDMDPTENAAGWVEWSYGECSVEGCKCKVFNNSGDNIYCMDCGHTRDKHCW